jgi:hypothetical protein
VNGLEGISAHQLSDAIGDIYDYALDPGHWPTTCRRIADLCNSMAGGIGVHEMKQVRKDQLFVFGYLPAFLERLGHQYSESPMAAADIVANVGGVNALSDELRALFESRFYREVMAPFGRVDMVRFPGLRSGGRMTLHVSRSEKGPHYAMHELRLFKLFALHICSALTISDTLDIRALKSQMPEETLDGLAAGVYVIARDGQVVYMNTAGQQQMSPATRFALCTTACAPWTPSRAAVAQNIEIAGHDSPKAA